VTAAEFIAHLADRRVVLGACGDELTYRGPGGALTADVIDVLRARKAEILDLLRRDRFTRFELDALGFRGTQCADGSGMYEVRADGSIETLIMRLGLFDVEPEIREGHVWLVGRSPADDPAAVLPPKLLAEARARADELRTACRTRGDA